MISKRHADILRILDNQGTVTVTALAESLGVSTETVRRDLRPLTDDGAVLRMHGAVSLSTPSGEAPFRRRMRENAQSKQSIALSVAAMLRDGDTVMMDTGTTTSFVARALTALRPGLKNLTVITNSTDIALTLTTAGSHRVLLAGGEVFGDSGAVLGSSAVAFLRGFQAGVAVLSAGGIDAAGVTDFDMAETDFARAMLDQAQRVVIACDSTKFGRRALVRVADFSRLQDVVTDAPPPADIAAAMAAAGTRLVLAQA